MEIPNTWKILKIHEIAKTASGGTPSRKKTEYFGGEIPWLKSGELNNGIVYHSDEKITKEGLDNSSAKIFPPNTLLVAMYGATIGKTAILGNASSTNQAICAISPIHDSFSPKYMLYWLQFQKDELINKGKGGAQPNISQTIIKEHDFPLAPLPEQKRIVAKIEELFTQLDAGITELEQAKIKLKRYRQSVLKAAVEGELTKEWRETHKDEIEPASVLFERILDERRAKWEEEQFAKMQEKGKEPKDDKWKEKYKEPVGPDFEDLPELPEGWVWTSFKQIAEIASNLVDPTKLPNFIHIAPNHIEKGGTGKLLPYKTVKEDGVTSPKHHFYPGQIIYSKIRPYLAKAVIVEFEGVCSADMYPINSNINASYLLRWLLNPDFTKAAAKHQGRTVLPKINQHALNKLPVPVPPKKEQEIISQRIERRISIAEQISKEIEMEISRANKIRQSILKQAFEGNLVPQNPEDEPAEKLLKKITKGKNG